MMKEKSSKWARMRLLYIVPVTLIVIGAFASQKFVVQTAPLGSPSPETAAPENTSAMQAATVADEASPAAGLSAGETKETVPSQAATDLASAVAEGIESQPEPEKKVFDVVEVMPVFPGGETEMMKYVATQVRYPVIAEKNGVQGRFVVGFVITDEGKVTDVKIIDGPKGSSDNEVVVVGYSAESTDSLAMARQERAKSYQALEQEAMRVVKAMPDWKPGLQDGKPVNVQFAIPLTFRLQ